MVKKLVVIHDVIWERLGLDQAEPLEVQYDPLAASNPGLGERSRISRKAIRSTP